jgi:hypothetical protein
MNNPVRLLRCIAVGMLALNFVGCASIVHSGNRPVTIDSNPQGALVTITGKQGWELTSQTTPFTVRLDPYGGYFRGQTYTARFELAGYAKAETEIYPEMSPWYVGNILIGGLIGFVVVDPLTGCMWNLRPLHIEQAMVKLPEPPAPVPPPAPVAPPPPTPPAAPPDVVTPPVQAPTQSDSTNTVAPPAPAPTDANPPAQPPPPAADSTNSPAPPPITP